MGVTSPARTRPAAGSPEWPEGTGEHISGEGIFVEELRLELARRGIAPRLGGETHALADHDERPQRAAARGHAGRPPEGHEAGREVVPHRVRGRPLREPAARRRGRGGGSGRGGLGRDAAARPGLPGRDRRAGSWPRWPSRPRSSAATATGSCWSAKAAGCARGAGRGGAGRSRADHARDAAELRSFLDSRPAPPQAGPGQPAGDPRLARVAPPADLRPAVAAGPATAC